MSRVRIMPTLSSSGGSLAPGAAAARNGAVSMKGGSQQLVRAGPQPRLDAGDVARVDGQHQVGRRQRALDGAMAEPRRALGAARRMRGLGDHIGHAQRRVTSGPSQSGLR